MQPVKRAFKTLDSAGFENPQSFLRHYGKPAKWTLRCAVAQNIKTREAGFYNIMENSQSGAWDARKAETYLACEASFQDVR